MKNLFTRMTNGAKAMLTKALSVIGIDDIYFWTGLVCLWTGCRSVYPPSAPIVCGVILMGVGLYSATRGIS